MLKQNPVHWYSTNTEEVYSGWRAALQSFIKMVDKLSLVAALLAAVLCAMLAVLTGVLVILGAFNWGHNGLEELKWHLCGSLFLLSGAYCLERNAHVRVDTFYAQFRPRVKATVDALGIMLFVWPMALAVCYFGFGVAIDSMAEASNDAGGLTHRWIIKSVIPLGFALLFIQSLAVFLRALLCIFSSGTDDAELLTPGTDKVLRVE